MIGIMTEEDLNYDYCNINFSKISTKINRNKLIKSRDNTYKNINPF